MIAPAEAGAQYTPRVAGANPKPEDRVQVLQRRLYQSAKGKPSKRYGVLYDKIKTKEVLRESWKRVARNGGSAGVDGKSIKWIKEYGEERYLEEIRQVLETEEYRPDKIRRCYIPKPDGSERPLGIPTVTDRVVQMAVKLVIEPLFEAGFQNCSFGFRPNRSAHQALTEVDRGLWQGCRWVVDVDIANYFDTIPHDRLLNLVQEKVRDPKVLRFIRWWLKAGILQKNGKVTYPSLGTPQGGVLSPLLANIYLNHLDTEWTKQGYAKRWKANSRLVRYADDFVILCPTEEKAGFFYRKVEEIVTGLGLKVNTQKSQVVYAKEGFNFLGFTYRLGYSKRLKKEVPVKIPRAKAMQKIRGQIKELVMRIPLGKDIQEVIPEVNTRLKGWVNYFRVGNIYKDSLKLSEFACFQLRIFLRRKYQTKRCQWYQRFPNHYFYERGLYYVPSLI